MCIRDRDYVISERPSRPTYQDIVRGLADEYSQPRKPRIGGHGDSVALPLPAVSGGSDDPLPLARTYTGGYLRSDEYGLIEGTGQQLVRDAMQVYFSVVDGMAVERPVKTDNDTAEISYIPCYRNHDVEQLQRDDEYVSQQTVYPALTDVFRNLAVMLGALYCIVAIGLIGWLAAGWIALDF